MPFKPTDETLKSFSLIEEPRDLAIVLEVSYNLLTEVLYRTPQKEKYRTFEISKKGGGARTIEAPAKWLKLIQTRLNLILLQSYQARPSTHGFVLNRSIVTNAKQHLRKKNLVNFDLKDFFSTIHFGRVKGLFKNHPFNFNEKIAGILANLCCNEARLPQGAPTSPILSNFICRGLDTQLLNLCIQNKCKFSRYADDITISTNLVELPVSIGVFKNNEFSLSKEILDIISQNGFTINPSKTRFANKTNRREVTGLIVNDKVNVKRNYLRNIRLLLHNWEKHGLLSAANDYYSQYSQKQVSPAFIGLKYKKELAGKIGFVGFIKGKDNPVYVSLVRRIRALAPDAAVSVVINDNKDATIPMIYGEGKSDWKHLKAAYNYFKSIGKYQNLNLRIRDYDSRFEINNTQLLEVCKSLSKTSITRNIVICIFDADAPRITKEISENGSGYKYWHNNVYSMVIPKPPHRNFDEICIEHYYLDSEIVTLDENKRRLFTSDEFMATGDHKTEALTFRHPNKLNRGYPYIIDYGVFYNETNVALPKNQFADYVLSRHDGFKNFRFQHFSLIFDKIEQIISNHTYE
ncbi:MAG: reverse transcriptase domain-containing protein [Chitinophagaceae bacterium]